MILEFNQIKRSDLSIVGGKAANLGELTSLALNVPRGFVISTNAYNEFLKHNNLDKEIINNFSDHGSDEENLSKSAFDFRENIIKGNFSTTLENTIIKAYRNLGESTRVAVRSSATAEDLEDASFAGQQETFLNVRDIDEVLHKVKECFASLFSDRALAYRNSKDYDKDSFGIAVIIQEMVESEKSGVLFTANPLNKNENEMLINSSFGLGESVVSGKVTADSFLTDKNGNLLETYIATKESQIVYASKGTVEVEIADDKRTCSSLDENEIKELCKIASIIEGHYNMPMDIEWAIKEKEIFILQARAITTLSTSEEIDKNLVNKYIENIKIKKRNREMMSFLVEKIPFSLKALEFDYLMAIDEQKKNIFAENGISVNSNLQMNDVGIMTIKNEKKRPNHRIFNVVSNFFKLKSLDYSISKSKEFMPIYESKIKEFECVDFESMSLTECRDFIIETYELTEKLAYDRFRYSLFPMFINNKKFDKIAKKVNKNYSSFDLYWELNNKTAVVTNDIINLAKEIEKDSTLKEAILSKLNYNMLCERFPNFKELTDGFMSKNGYKSGFTVCMVEGKSFIEKPERLINILIPLLEYSDFKQLNDSHDFSALMKSIESIYGNKYEKIKTEIEQFRYLHYVREESQYLWESIFHFSRQCLARVNKLLLGSEDYKRGVANLFYNEIIEVMEEGTLSDYYRSKIQFRLEKYPLASKVWDETKLLLFDFDSDVLKGLSGSKGTAVGSACIIVNTSEFHKMKKGDILVCNYTDPEWTPLFKLASGVVADTGSALSHAAIVAREYNIPAVLGVGYASTRFKDGDMIAVDGDKGEVKGA